LIVVDCIVKSCRLLYNRGLVWTDYKITFVCSLSFCQSVCKHFYGLNFDSILMKFCTVIRGPKSKLEFVWDKKNLITPFRVCP